MVDKEPVAVLPPLSRLLELQYLINDVRTLLVEHTPSEGREQVTI
jgi:hypothetical protein